MLRLTHGPRCSQLDPSNRVAHHLFISCFSSRWWLLTNVIISLDCKMVIFKKNSIISSAFTSCSSSAKNSLQLFCYSEKVFSKGKVDARFFSLYSLISRIMNWYHSNLQGWSISFSFGWVGVALWIWIFLYIRCFLIHWHDKSFDAQNIPSLASWSAFK